MLHQASMPSDYQCKQCELKFSHRSTTARFARVFLLLIIYGFAALFALIIIGFIVSKWF